MGWLPSTRTAVRIVANAETAPVLKHTVTTGKTLYITDLLITIENTETNAAGILEIYDDLSATGTPVLSVYAADPAPQSSSVTTITHTFTTPLEYSTGVFWNEAAGILTMSGLMLGYEE